MLTGPFVSRWRTHTHTGTWLLLLVVVMVLLLQGLKLRLGGGLRLHLPLVMVRKRSWPAVSHICSFTHLLSRKTFLILKSILHGSVIGSKRLQS